jgi:hypothetical protein
VIGKQHVDLDMVVPVYNPSTWEAEAVGLRVQVQPGLHNKTLSQKVKLNIKLNVVYKNAKGGQVWCLTHVIPVTQEANRPSRINS